MNHCEKNRELIIKRTVAPLREKVEESLQEHIKICESCRQFEAKIMAIERAGDKVLHVVARPKVKSFLLKKMRAQYQKSQNIFGQIRHLFAYRVALYQAALVSLLLLFLLLAAPKLKTPHQVSETQFMPTLADTMSMNVINLQQIIEIVDSQKVGSNLSEDTVLAKILYTL